MLLGMCPAAGAQFLIEHLKTQSAQLVQRKLADPRNHQLFHKIGVLQLGASPNILLCVKIVPGLEPAGYRERLGIFLALSRNPGFWQWRRLHIYLLFLLPQRFPEPPLALRLCPGQNAFIDELTGLFISARRIAALPSAV